MKCNGKGGTALIILENLRLPHTHNHLDVYKRQGIICDGKNYRRTKTVRDREIVQNNVLKALGWNICRIWTMDWWEKPDEVMASIQAAIAQDMKAEKPVIVKKEQEKREKNVQETPMQLKSACVYTNFSFISVQNYNNTKIRPFLYAADDIFAKRNNPIIVSQVQKIIENEAPISKTLLGKKIISEWGVNQMCIRDRLSREPPPFWNSGPVLLHWTNTKAAIRTV